jgi:alpha-tubulin suppressor-like RCC1 family protein
MAPAAAGAAKRAVTRFLVTAGDGAHGRLGHGWGCASQLFPRVVTGLAAHDLAAVSCGGAHTAVLAADGAVHTMGLNTGGQLGHSDGQPFVPTPVEVPVPDAVAGVSAGEAHTLCVTSSGEVWAWGSNDAGQLGVAAVGVGGSVGEPRLVGGALRGARVVAVAAGNHHSLAMTDDGRLYAWGDNKHGALGLGPSPALAPSPTLVPALWQPRVRAIAAGHFHSGALDAEGGAWVWGHGQHWALGLGEKRLSVHTPVPLGLSLVASLALGGSHSMAVRTTEHVAIWGADEHGSLGQGARWPQPPLLRPAPLPLQLKQAAAGWRHSAGVTSDGRLFCWGWSGAVGAGGLLDPGTDLGGGQLGSGTLEDLHVPTQVQRIAMGRPGSGLFRDLRASAAVGAQGRAYAGGSGGGWRALQVACGRNHTAAVVEIPNCAPWELA